MPQDGVWHAIVGDWRVTSPGRGVFAPLTCDEYPFAATFQGAAFFPHSNSTFPVPGDQNSREGALRVAMYKSERLLNKDPYFVFIVN